ncbi:hypothetical protein AAE478_001323 [Parahypoxylon ruwenzoriense]
MDSDSTLTFGVELEFIVTTKIHYEHPKEVYEAMAEVFLKNLASPLPCACIHGKYSKYKGVAYRYPDGEALEKKQWKDYYCFFAEGSTGVNTRDRTHLQSQGKEALGMEISTRVLDFTKIGCSEFKAVLDAVGDGGKLSKVMIAPELKPLSTSSTALHVHIGVKSGLDLVTVKRAAVLGWLLEPCLFSLCNDDRGKVSHAPVRKDSILARGIVDLVESGSSFSEIPDGFSAQEKRWLATILAARDKDDLAALLSSSNENAWNRRLALAIYNREDDHTTLEFRHFQSTMDYGLAWKWIRIAAALVQLATRPLSEYKKKLQLIADEYRDMEPKWKQHLWDRTFQKETIDPWLRS